MRADEFEVSPMDDMSMTMERVAALIDAFGASPERWPEAERQQALALLAQSASARELLHQARELDLLLDAAPVAPPSRALEDRIMAARPRPVAKPAFVASSRSVVRSSFFARLWSEYRSAALPTGMLAASILLGMGFGSTVNTSSLLGTTSLTSSSARLTMASNEAAGDQLLALALSESSYTEEMIR